LRIRQFAGKRKVLPLSPDPGNNMTAELKTPLLTVDLIIQMDGNPGEIVLIERKNPPHGWALPGGFVDLGETVEEAAVREAKEETSLDVQLLRQFHVYSDPRRDLRSHSVTVVFVAQSQGVPEASDDAASIGVFTKQTLPSPIVFDHAQILDDFFQHCY
jgi:8-oxo-dGTP diphosphatase